MRIGFDAKRAFLNRTGLGNYGRTLINCLIRQYPENEYLLGSPCKSEISGFVFPEANATQPAVDTVQGNSQKCVQAYSILPSKGVHGRLWRTMFLGRSMRKFGVDLFHGLSNELPLDIGETPSIVTIHDVAFRTFTDMYSFPDRIIYNRKWKFACEKATHIIAISESTKRDVQRFYDITDNRISVIFQPVQDEFYTPLSQIDAQAILKPILPFHNKGYLLSVGSINSRKNLMNTLKAYSAIRPENRPPLVVVGNGGKYMAECKSFAQRKIGKNEVVWLHNIGSTRELQSLYACAIALLYPSYYEGMGLPIIEALLQGCPVLTSNVSSLPEAAGPGALLANPADVEDIMHCMCRFIDDKDFCARLSRAGEEYVRQKFSSDVLTNQMMDLYHQVTNLINL